MNIFKFRQQQDGETQDIKLARNGKEKPEMPPAKTKHESSRLNGADVVAKTAVSSPPPPPKPSPTPPPQISTAPYASSEAHVWDELMRIDQLIRAQTMRWRMTIAASKPEHLWGMLHVTDAEVAAYFQAPFAPTHQLPDELTQALQPFWQTAVSLAKTIQSRREQTTIPLPLDLLQTRFGLSDFAKDILLVCLLSEVDGRYRRLFGYLQDDVSRTRPTIDLILQILHPLCPDVAEGRAAFAPHAPLLHHHLLTLEGNGRSDEPTAMQTVQIDPRIVNFLLGQNQIDGRLTNIITSPPGLDWSVLSVGSERLEQLQSLAEWLPTTPRGAVCLLHGPYGSGRLPTARALCSSRNMPLLVVDVGKMLQASMSWELAVDLCYRETVLWGTAVYWSGCEQLLENESTQAHWQYLLETANQFNNLTFLSTERYWQPNGRFLTADKPFLHLKCPIPTYNIRRQLWESYLAATSALGTNADYAVLAHLLANSFQFTEGQIRDSLLTAQGLAIQQNPQTPHLTIDNLYAGCRHQSSQQLVSMARRIEPRSSLSLNDIILPPANHHQLDELLIRIQHRSQVYNEMGFEKRLSLGKGIIALFTGSSGTGKTMAAELLANAQGVDLYKVDLSAVVSKYVGETEKNLSRVFTEAEGSNAIIVFDEADALFGKRGEVKEARDRWANMEINFLLQRIEEYAGVVILTSNLRQNIDEAFLRRIHVIIEFPFPSAEARYHILQGLFPDNMIRPSDDDLHMLAEKFELAGGSLKNIVLEAAFRALADNNSTLPVTVTLRHLIGAMAREYQKLSKPITQGEFGPAFYDWIEKDILRRFD